MTEPDPRRWQVLVLVCVAFFMTVLDVSIVTVALPSIARSLRLSANNLQWVLTAYAISFGGFLLLGGRVADLLGRRLMFMAGLALFSVMSLTCGLSGSLAMLVTSRALQGLERGDHLTRHLVDHHDYLDEGMERNKALGIWGAMGGGGAAAGVLFGGILTKYLGWESIFSSTCGWVPSCWRRRPSVYTKAGPDGTAPVRRCRRDERDRGTSPARIWHLGSTVGGVGQRPDGWGARGY